MLVFLFSAEVRKSQKILTIINLKYRSLNLIAFATLKEMLCLNKIHIGDKKSQIKNILNKFVKK